MVDKTAEIKPSSPTSADYIDPLNQIIAKWRWKPVAPLDEKTARKIGGAFFQMLFDNKTSYQPTPGNHDEEIYFAYLKKMHGSQINNDEPRKITITPEEIATVLKLSQAATLTKALIREKKELGVFTADIASDALLEEIYELLEQIQKNPENAQFIAEIDQILNALE